jgi:hypothetical protein
MVSSKNASVSRDRRKENSEDDLQLALASGLFMNAARKCGEALYRALPLNFMQLSGSSSSTDSGLSMLHVHPSSVLARSTQPGAVGSVEISEYVVYQSLQCTNSRIWMRNVQSVSSHTLRALRTGWKPTHPLVLSGRPVPVIDVAIGDELGPEHKKRQREADVEGGAPTAQHTKADKTAAVASARARYLARKN